MVPARVLEGVAEWVEPEDVAEWAGAVGITRALAE